MNLATLLGILSRWKRVGLYSFAGFLFVSLAMALLPSQVYESQAILERKPAKFSPQLNPKQGEEFDVYRLTSESQRSVALLKSRYMLERWYDALGLPGKTPAQKESGLDQLRDSLSVQPVSYTDLFVVKVRAKSPEESQRRTQTLIDLFSDWDLSHDRHEAEQLVGILQERLDLLTRELVRDRTRLQAQKSGLSLSLTGSASARQLEAGVNAKGLLYDRLTAELEAAGRELTKGAISRTRVLAPPTIPGKPLFSRAAKAFIGFCLSLILAGALMLLLEGLTRSDLAVHQSDRASPKLAVHH